MARQYRLLPSEVAERATTFDVMVLDVMTTWEEYRRDPENAANYKTEDLEKLVKRTKAHEQ